LAAGADQGRWLRGSRLVEQMMKTHQICGFESGNQPYYDVVMRKTFLLIRVICPKLKMLESDSWLGGSGA
jgi:hypothetical protein